MKVYVFIVLIATFVTLTIYGTSNYGASNSMKNAYVPAGYVVMANEITGEVQAKLLKRYKRHKISTVGIMAGMADCVNAMGLEFLIHGHFTKDELRKMLVDSLEEYLSPINSNEKLRPYLKNYPFTTNEVEITFYIRDEKGNSLFDPNISLAYSSRGKLYFYTVDKNDTYGFKVQDKEDYETAKKIVEESSKNRG